MPAQPKPIMITDLDLDRLADVISLYGDVERVAAAALERELEQAVVVRPTAVASSVVTMNSQVLCRDESGATRELAVVYPRRADPSAGRISVLAPLGRALLGAAVGDEIEVVGPRGARAWSVLAIRYQPEAAGDYHL